MRSGLKAAAMLVLLALAMLATACGGGDDDDGGDASQAAAADAGSSAAGGASSGEQAAPSGDAVEIEMWHGYGELAAPGEEPNYEYDWLKAAVDAFEASHPGITVKLTYVNSDVALEKLTVALQGGKAPDVTYQYGTNIAQLATSDKTVDLTERVNAPEYDWADFPQGERDAFTVDGKVYGVPALVDNLAVVYNKDLFAKAGLTEPGPDWTWDELVADAKALTERGRQAVRARVADRRVGDRGLEVHRDAVGGRRRHPHARRHEDGVRLAAGRHRADRAAAAGRGQDAAPGPDAGQPEDGAAVQRRQARHVHHGAVAARRLPGRELRRAGHAVVPRRLARDHRGPGRLGAGRQRRREGRGRLDLPAVADGARSRSCRRPSRPATCRRAPRSPRCRSSPSSRPSSPASTCSSTTSPTSRRRGPRSPPTRRSRTAIGHAVTSVVLGEAEPEEALQDAAQAG